MVPAIFYGTYKDVQYQTKSLMKKIIKGHDIVDLISNLEMLDAKENNALILTHRLSVHRVKAPCFMLFMLCQEISRAGYSLDTPVAYRPSQYKTKPLSYVQEEIFFLKLLNTLGV